VQRAKRKSRGAPAAKAVDPFRVPSAAAWEKWLERNHARSQGVWLTIAKKGSGLRTPTHEEALEAALAWGWIDAQARPLDGNAWLQRFCPRRPKGLWSQRNREKVAALERAGRMRPPGAAAVLAAKQDGRWDAAYAPPSRAALPNDLARALAASPKAAAFFATLDAANRYAVVWRVTTARKAETRASRIEKLVEMLTRGERIHPKP
jgi:uncharacterized protein YdeI (YjbR/CyaY-like superfamily)